VATLFEPRPLADHLLLDRTEIAFVDVPEKLGGMADVARDWQGLNAH